MYCFVKYLALYKYYFNKNWLKSLFIHSSYLKVPKELKMISNSIVWPYRSLFPCPLTYHNTTQCDPSLVPLSSLQYWKNRNVLRTRLCHIWSLDAQENYVLSKILGKVGWGGPLISNTTSLIFGIYHKSSNYMCSAKKNNSRCGLQGSK